MFSPMFQVDVAKEHIAEHCNNEELKSKLLAGLEELKTDSEFDIISELEQTLTNKITEMEETLVKKQVIFQSLSE